MSPGSLSSCSQAARHAARKRMTGDGRDRNRRKKKAPWLYQQFLEKIERTAGLRLSARALLTRFRFLLKFSAFSCVTQELPQRLSNRNSVFPANQPAAHRSHRVPAKNRVTSSLLLVSLRRLDSQKAVICVKKERIDPCQPG